jgi:hypothetical protein
MLEKTLANLPLLFRQVTDSSLYFAESAIWHTGKAFFKFHAKYTRQTLFTVDMAAV